MGIRALTGPLMRTMDAPPSLVAPLRELCDNLDDNMLALVTAVAPTLFGTETLEGLSSAAGGLPLLDRDPNWRFGMLDVVRYVNARDGDAAARGMNVEQHGDPGLFALSLFSTAPGLQMRDIPSQQWVDIPPTTAVLWCGAAAIEASAHTLRAGEHRVVCHSSPRTTAWYEVCTHEQVPVPLRTMSRQGFSLLRGGAGAGAGAATSDADATAAIDKPALTSVAPCAPAAAASKLPRASLDRHYKVTVKTLTGKRIELLLFGDCTIEYIKEKVEEKEGIPPPKQRLIFGGRALADERRASDYGITDGSVLHLGTFFS